jgi:ubiquinol-cytochrome c reductase cytochrome c1 subunit
VYDVVNFMTYMSEPSRLESERIGYKVLIFLAILFVFAFALKKEYWKDVH